MKKYIIACILVVLCLFTVVLSASAENTAGEQPAFCSLGDVNGDNTVTSVDARLALRASAKLQILDEGPLKRADIVKDGNVSAADARTILRIAAKLDARPVHQIEILPGTPGSCTTNGITEGKKCVACEEIIVAQEEIIATGHKEVVLPAVAATCTEAGLTEGKKCSVCDMILVAQTAVPATGHTEEDVPYVAPGCAQPGHEAGKKCSVCDTIISGCGEIAATNHAGTIIVIPGKDATCTKDGLSEVQFCALCGKILTVQQVIPAKGHTEDELRAVDAKCTETGLTAGKKCSVCNEILVAQEVIPATGHTEEEIPAIAATCTQYGLTAGKKCSACKVILEAQVSVPANGHTEVITQAVEATCESAGSTRGITCSVCDVVLVEAKEIPATGHTEEEIPAVAATCTETGLTAGKKCSVCDEVITAQEEIPAAGHTEAIIEATPATCLEDGLTEGKYCSVCNETLVAQEVVAATGHTEEEVPAVAVTCTTAGLEAGKKCSVCQKILTAQIVIPATGHTEEILAYKAPECTVTGLEEGVKCSVCDEILVAQEEIPALGHTEVVDAFAAATCTETGLTEGKHCSVCSEILIAQETIPANGHEEVILKGSPVTCLEDGITEGKYCSVCNETLIAQNVIPATGHKESVVPAVEESFTVKGSTEGLVCENCDAVFVATEEIPEKLVVMVDDANAWALDNGADALLGAETDGTDLALEIKVDAIWGDNNVAESAFDGLLTNIGSYLDEHFGNEATIMIDGEKVYSEGKLHNTAVKNTIFNVGEGFFYNIANLADDGVYGTYNIEVTSIVNGAELTENIEFRVIFTGNNIDKIKTFAAVVAEHISMTVVDGDTVIDIEAPEKLIETLNTTYTKETFEEASVAEILADIASYDSDDIFGSQAAAMDKLISTLCGFEGVFNKILDKVVSATVATTDGTEWNLLEPGAQFGVKGDVKDFGAFVDAFAAMLNEEEICGLSMDAFAIGNGVYSFPVTVSVDMGNLGAMDNDIITETVIFNIHMPVAEVSVEEKLSDVADKANEWSQANLGGLVSAEVADKDLVIEIDVDVIWNDGTINADAFDGLLTNLGKYLDEDLDISSVSIDGENVYSEGKLHNTAVKNTIFNVGEGFFYNIANLTDDGVYGVYTVVADGETFTLTVKFTGNKLGVIKGFAAVVAEHISMQVVDGDTVIDVQMPEAYMNNTCAGLTEEEICDLLANVTVGQFFDELENQGAEGTFGSQATAINKIAYMLCGYESVVNKVVGKIESMTVLVDGEEVNVLKEGAEFDPKGENADFSTLMDAITAMLSDEFRGMALGMLLEDGTLVFPITITVDMGNLDAMDNAMITETIIINLNLF